MRETIDEAFTPDEALVHDRLAKLPLLDASINEAMRVCIRILVANTAMLTMPQLEPPIPFQNQRIVPEGGWIIGDTLIPAGTHVRSALYAISRSSSNFAQPDEFRPERWLPESRADGEAFNAKASIPFILGPYHCVGRNFAIQEMRYTVAALVRRYDMQFAEDFSRQDFEKGVEDRSLLEIEYPLKVVIQRRA